MGFVPQMLYKNKLMGLLYFALTLLSKPHQADRPALRLNCLTALFFYELPMAAINISSLWRELCLHDATSHITIPHRWHDIILAH